MIRITTLESFAQAQGYAVSPAARVAGSLVDYSIDGNGIRVLILVRDGPTLADLQYLAGVGDPWDKRVLYLPNASPKADFYTAAERMKVAIATRPEELPLLPSIAASTRQSTVLEHSTAFIIMAFGETLAGFLPAIDICAAAKRACEGSGRAGRANLNTA